jgi:hypothetical protein
MIQEKYIPSERVKVMIKNDYMQSVDVNHVEKNGVIEVTKFYTNTQFEYKEKITYSTASSSDTEYVWDIATSSSKKNDTWDSYPCYGCSKIYKWSNLNEMGLCDTCEDYHLNKRPSFYNKLSRGTLRV